MRRNPSPTPKVEQASRISLRARREEFRRRRRSETFARRSDGASAGHYRRTLPVEGGEQLALSAGQRDRDGVAVAMPAKRQVVARERALVIGADGPGNRLHVAVGEGEPRRLARAEPAGGDTEEAALAGDAHLAVAVTIARDFAPAGFDRPGRR